MILSLSLENKMNYSSGCADEHIPHKEYSVDDTSRPFDFFEKNYQTNKVLCTECYSRINVDCYIKFEPKSRCIQLKSFDTPSEHWTLLFGKKNDVSLEDIKMAHERIIDYVDKNPLIFYPMIALFIKHIFICKLFKYCS